MGKASINMKVDTELKKDAEQLFKDLGMSMSTAITVFLKQSVREGKIPFSISSLRSTPNEETIRAIEEAEQGKNLSKEYTSVKELMRDLLSEDD